MNAYGDEVVLVHAPLTGGWGGQQVRDWDNATRTTYAAAVQPRGTQERTDQRQVTTTDMVVFLAPEVPVLAVDRFEWRGHTYEVEGEPAVHNMGGVPDHVEVVVNRVDEAAV